VDRGRVIASGTPDELKRQVGGDRVEVRLSDVTRTADAVTALRELAAGEPVVDAAVGTVGIPAAREAAAAIVGIVRVLDRHGIAVQDISVHRPTLDDVFVAVTSR